MTIMFILWITLARRLYHRYRGEIGQSRECRVQVGRQRNALIPRNGSSSDCTDCKRPHRGLSGARVWRHPSEETRQKQEHPVFSLSRKATSTIQYFRLFLPNHCLDLCTITTTCIAMQSFQSCNHNVPPNLLYQTVLYVCFCL